MFRQGECANFFLPVERPDATPRDSPRSFCATPEEHGMPVWTDRSGGPTGPAGPGDDESQASHCVCVPSYIVHGDLVHMFAFVVFVWLSIEYNIYDVCIKYIFFMCLLLLTYVFFWVKILSFHFVPLWGLLEAWEGKARRSKAAPEQNFHHEMLKKLALHLAAQPGGGPLKRFWISVTTFLVGMNNCQQQIKPGMIPKRSAVFFYGSSIKFKRNNPKAFVDS